ncbi:MAG: hypothetical protein Q9207_003124 [Kuettlingeria erythrocarpa]
MPSDLPAEVLLQIVAYVEKSPDRQRNIWAMTMVSRAWYSAAISSLYHSPAISGRNFTLFVRTLCPSVIAHVRKTSFSSMVKELDMSRLVHDSCKSLTARILSRLKSSLEVFIAPRASFACVKCTGDFDVLTDVTRVNCLAALSKCQNLQQLDLSLVTENIGLPQILHAIRRLGGLQSLSIRCKDGIVQERAEISWPPLLTALHVSGMSNNGALAYFYSLPKSLTSLTVHDSPRLDGGSVKDLVTSLGHSIENLHIGVNTLETDSEFDFGVLEEMAEYRSLQKWLDGLPKLRRLHLFLPWIEIAESKGTPGSSSIYNAQNPHPLEYLELDFRHILEYWGPAGFREHHDAFYDAIAEGYLARLRRVAFFHHADALLEKTDKQMLLEMDELLRALAREDGENATIREEHAGVRVVYVRDHVKCLSMGSTGITLA